MRRLAPPAKVFPTAADRTRAPFDSRGPYPVQNGVQMGYTGEPMTTQSRLEDRRTMDKTHSILHERIQGREAELLNPLLRATLVIQLAKETKIHADFIEGFLDGLDDPSSSSFETRKTRRLLPVAK